MDNLNTGTLWFFCDYNGTYDVIENNNSKLEKFFSTLDTIRQQKHLEKTAFNFVSINDCEFLEKKVGNIKDFLTEQSTHVPNKEKLLFSSVLGEDGFILNPYSEESRKVFPRSHESKAEQIYDILSFSKDYGEFIYMDDKPSFNLLLLSRYMKNKPLDKIQKGTFIGNSNKFDNAYIHNFETVMDDSDDFLVNGLIKYSKILHNQDVVKE